MFRPSVCSLKNDICICDYRIICDYIICDLSVHKSEYLTTFRTLKLVYISIRSGISSPTTPTWPWSGTCRIESAFMTWTHRRSVGRPKKFVVRVFVPKKKTAGEDSAQKQGRYYRPPGMTPDPEPDPEIKKKDLLTFLFLINLK